MSTDLLSRLDGVRNTGSDRWIAKCPSHEDRSPSLSISVTDDGKTLVHCFAGCGAADVLEAVGLKFSDLFPDRPKEINGKPRRHIPDWRALLRCAAWNARILAIGAERMVHGDALDDDDMRLIREAHRNLEAYAGRWA